MAAPLGRGAMLGAFRLDRLVAEGGMGAVYEATDTTLHRRVAVKVVSAELADDARYRERFREEARLAASLDHPAIVPVYYAGHEDGRVFLAMRYVEGGTLADLLARVHRLAPDQAVRLLRPIADALDTAHASGLIHRDVKPGNILIDGDQAFLADFGLARPVTSADSAAGTEHQLSGTLAYLAPEQIDGRRGSAQTDQYGLACVLFECVDGHSPFQRDDAFATVRAHLSESPPTLAGPALADAADAAIARGLAKSSDERYSSCVELIDAFAAACDGPRPRSDRPRRGRRRIAVVGGTALVATAALVGALSLGATGRRGHSLLSAASPAALSSDAIAQVDINTGRILRSAPTGSAPLAAAVGGGAIWAINADDQTVSKIDPRSLRSRTFSVGATPYDLAFGDGVLWVATGVGSRSSSGGVVDSLTAIDPDTTSIIRRIALPGGTANALGASGPGQIAVGLGAVWVVDPDGTVARIDPTGRQPLAVVRGLQARRIAIDTGAAWALGDHLWQIDPAKAQITSAIDLQTTGTAGLAVGDRAVWVADPWRGLVIRVDPGPPVLTSTVQTAPGVSTLAFAGHALWVANPLAGTLIEIDTTTDHVVRTVPIGGAPQAVAIDRHGVWVPALAVGGRASATSVSPGRADVHNGTCTSVYRAARAAPQFLIASDFSFLPDAVLAPIAPPMTDAIRFVLQEHGFRAGRYSVGYQSCAAPISDALTDSCLEDASAYATTPRVLGVIGTGDENCALALAPNLNRAARGPLAMVSPINSNPTLTGWAGIAPTGTRSFARVIPADSRLGAAAAQLAQSLGVRRPYVVANDNLDWGFGPGIAGTFEIAARQLGLHVTGTANIAADADRQYSGIARAAARAESDGVFFLGLPTPSTGKLIVTLRRALGSRAQLLTTEPYGPLNDYVRYAGAAALGLRVVTALPTTERLSDTGRKWARRFASSQLGGAVSPWAPLAAQATELLLSAIARSDGTRASVSRELLRSDVRDGILGTFRLTADGDIDPYPFTVLRVIGGSQPSPNLQFNYQGSVVEKVLDVPASLGESEEPGDQVSLTTDLPHNGLGSRDTCTTATPCTAQGSFRANDIATGKLICAGGTASERYWFGPDGIGDAYVIGDRTLRCHDGSALRMRVRMTDWAPDSESAAHAAETWAITGGTGRLARLRGRGTMDELIEFAQVDSPRSGTTTGRIATG